MKSDKEVKEMVDRLERYRAVVPQKDFFGGDNHGKADAQIEELKGYLDGDDLTDRVDELAGEDPDMEDEIVKARIEALDWVEENIDDPLVEESDIKMFADKKARGE